MLDHTASQQAWLVEVVVGVRGGRDWRCAGDRMVKVLTTVYSPVLVVTVSSSSHQTDCDSPHINLGQWCAAPATSLTSWKGPQSGLTRGSQSSPAGTQTCSGQQRSVLLSGTVWDLRPTSQVICSQDVVVQTTWPSDKRKSLHIT